ncbi:MAG: tRNA (guanosine(37)-N1)-methyltransferase TrmD [Candidatus Komeilibacteria bacterium CG11_big_fil_rev_8_21_14_0_20_36_20]|uniref:tRNA (guanine-N(1)-)-methyltransferase n=1 Tax=Candidatus Komeilibacteria bacterium CG11_big_fil_rev_8_21_14_0_20_36_20 TaxID=1974477 RepID=A0A2H0NCC6_9BACT|nr:MAG: tRNA (guanosine(37)-N1)-methyltransferase TrmD [Candidatus Komeilibacteria bacterium CG11_big_fil_rev_8_21_14_0_20_36_20]PIR81876.1 MAG: tRNA (guanosine(37)-N1)-methyltransferase TrmD [Candidatus Komeilibacteria bacterium CG10_big_fil_rev_8_21_14_0_10_36_65]PJC54917.1 MAG: tRNA (guanosine(37)-N1)-methyltransferase TrmD [Candidatus Komeilibacteria bacterium CG_4_9_14_0_2_um_filter_36_13]
MKFDILTIFPNSLDSYFNSSILAKAQKKKLITIKTHDIRDQATDKRKTVDDTPYGGGPGMVIQIEPVYKTLKKIYKTKSKNTQVILLSPQGKILDQNKIKQLAKYKRLILIAGHYESIDARIDKFVDQKISLGNFVLTGGELAAACVVDSVARLAPGVVGKTESVQEESFSEYNKQTKEFNIEYPQYTRPEEFRGLKVPKVLLSGNHGEIKKWRSKQTKQRK